MRKKIAIVVQRYGIEVNGGAEYHARILAEKLAAKYEISILTTTAIDYDLWENHYNDGEEFINNIKVFRFPTINMKSKKTRISRRAILKKKKYFKLLKKIGLYNFFDKRFNLHKVTDKQVENWIIGQGPYCPELIDYIETNKDNYDVFIFFTYLYYPTVKGMPIVAEKSIFIPTAHNEPLLFTKPYEKIFSIPAFIMYNTDSEKKLVENHFKEFTKNNDVAGVGIEDYSENLVKLPDYVEEKKYFIYIGRIDPAKGCKEMIKYFISFQEKHPEYRDYKLVLIGKNYMKEKYTSSYILYTGFVSEEIKYTLLKNSLAMIMPSFYESLSMVTLEAMNEKIPVIVNKNCEVLYEHIQKSKSGAFYNSKETFNQNLIDYIHKSEYDLEHEGERAKVYVQENYSWKKILHKFDQSIDFITKNNNL